MVFHPPIVTLDDLRSFHAKHFPAAPVPATFFYGAEAEAEEEVYGDDDLGYYEDGVQRTLTDDQIALFRHTEIQTIIRERRRKRVADDVLELEPAEIHRMEFKLEPAEIQRIESELTHFQNVEPLQTSSNHLAAKASVPPATTTAPCKDGLLNRVQNGRIEKEYSGKKENTRLKHKNSKNRKRNRIFRTEKRKKRREGSVHSDSPTDSEDDDEWSAQNQAHGPDTQKDTTIDLDY